MSLQPVDQHSDRAQATARAVRIRDGIHTLAAWQQDVIDAYRERDWLALGYTAWEDYLDGEYGEHRVRLPREQRQDVIADMRAVGMSTRAIASATGVSKSQVADDLRLSGSGQSDSDSPPVPSTVISLDGRRRPATQPPRPTPEPAAPRQPTMTEINAATPPALVEEYRRDSDRGVALLVVTDACDELAAVADPEKVAAEAPDYIAERVASVRPAIDVLTRFLAAWENR